MKDEDKGNSIAVVLGKSMLRTYMGEMDKIQVILPLTMAEGKACSR